jgi:hypothetical protein
MLSKPSEDIINHSTASIGTIAKLHQSRIFVPTKTVPSLVWIGLPSEFRVVGTIDMQFPVFSQPRNNSSTFSGVPTDLDLDRSLGHLFRMVRHLHGLVHDL